MLHSLFRCSLQKQTVDFKLHLYENDSRKNNLLCPGYNEEMNGRGLESQEVFKV
jgi:hypothetical protein